MDRRSWLWRRKSSEKSPGETESSGGSISSHSERFSDDQIVYLNQNPQSIEATSISEKLSEALATINAKEEFVKQHAKIAEEAVSGWEKAESEASALRQQVEVLTHKNSTLEDRVVHLDGALKECLRQLRQTREEKDQIAHESLQNKISRTEESSLTSVEAELHHKLEIAEKEKSALKLELSSMDEELEISIQAAEQASKQHLDGLRKVAQLEAECRRVNSALQKANDRSQKTQKTTYIVENGDLNTSRFGRNRMDSFLEMDLMDDFLEMERLVKKAEPLEHENELKPSRKRLEEAESELADRENKLKPSRNWLEEAEHENELMASRNRLQEVESKLAELENELEASRNQLEVAECKLADREKELKASSNWLKVAESKLAETESRLEMAEAALEATNGEREEAESQCKELKTKCKELEDKVSRLQNEVQCIKSTKRAEELRFLRVKQDTKLSMAESKFAECQKTIASLNRQLKRLATLDDFLIDTKDL